ncbi:hypothetical protein [Actinomadura flavalba]|uniref:hypothetical protein n=1 Tax=Actinomadura flavalba TaxID=1120938 RepID=UPI0006888A56|nr:hypothetical protein [Actinomadura flavalba]
MRELLVIMGSGETSPTMVGVHKEAARRPAVLLDTPYAFQENAADISRRACAYFARSVGLPVEVAAKPEDLETAGWIFSGPGSPTYALERWRGPVAETLRQSAATLVFASAAACVLGRVAVPVYEIYKVGADPCWHDGLDLLGDLGLNVAVVPHYDNAEGGTHDTRFAYLGERRLRRMEAALPDGTAVLGVDEHTAVLIDDRVRVRGRGGLTVRRAGASTVVPAGETLTLDELRALTRGGAVRRTPARTAAPAEPPRPTLKQTVLDARARFAAAEPAERVRLILGLEAAIADWTDDTEEDEGTDWARAVLRSLVTRLGASAALNGAVPALVAVRDELRAAGLYPLADRVRDALASGGVHLRDTPAGTFWDVGGQDARSRETS